MISRRVFVEGFGAFTAVSLTGCRYEERPLVRFGLVTDCHYADIPLAHRPMPVGDASYRESCDKLAEAVALFNKEKPDFAIELGDFKDLGPSKKETEAYLAKVEHTFAAFEGPRYHVLGNHDMDALTKDEFLSRIANADQAQTQAHYSFTHGGVTFITLDACYNSKLEPYKPGNWVWNDANVPPEELAWLEKTLAAAKGNVVVFCHQRLDPASDAKHLVKNAAAVRAILEKSGKVRAVFTGHQHSGGSCAEKGIFYYSLRALVLNPGLEENSYAIASVYPSGVVDVTGYRKAASSKGPRA